MVSNKFKQICMVFVPLLVGLLLQAAVHLIDVIIVFLRMAASKSATPAGSTVSSLMNAEMAQPMNIAYTNLALHLLFLLVFGLWYRYIFIKEETLPTLIKSNLKKLGILIPIALIIAGCAAQYMTDAVLTLLRPMLPGIFAAYDKVLESLIGVSSAWPSVLAAFLVAPFAEEFFFRGVILGYAKRLLPKTPAVLLTALLFGCYHGNLIQGVYATVFGILLGFLAVRFESLIPGILFHICVNGSLLFLPDPARFDTPFVILTGAVAALVLAGGIFFVFRKEK